MSSCFFNQYVISVLEFSISLIYSQYNTDPCDFLITRWPFHIICEWEQSLLPRHPAMLMSCFSSTRTFCPSPSVPDVLSQTFCPRRSVPDVLSQTFCPRRSVPDVLSQTFCPAFLSGQKVLAWDRNASRRKVGQKGISPGQKGGTERLGSGLYILRTESCYKLNMWVLPSIGIFKNKSFPEC